MKIKKCKFAKKKIKTVIFFWKFMLTGKFPSIHQKIKKEPISLVICKNCDLVQLGHSFNLNICMDRIMDTELGLTKLINHVNKVVKNLSKMAKIKKNDFVLDIAVTMVHYLIFIIKI